MATHQTNASGRVVNARRRSPEYRTWRGMISRCRYPSQGGYHNYGGRGIRVCQRWENSFEDFLADVGPKPSPGHSLDRIDTSGHYEPGNCRWATRECQNRNRRGNHLITFLRTTKTLSAWSELTGIGPKTIAKRLSLGWSVERALTEVVKQKGPKGSGLMKPIHAIWYSMRYRCTKPSDPQFPLYGGRGIKVCDRWANSFTAFVADMGARPSPDHQVDRIDNDGDYCPENCRWATRKEQANNRKTSVFIEHADRRMTATQWAKGLGCTPQAILARVRMGLSAEQVVTTPFRRSGRQGHLKALRPS